MAGIPILLCPGVCLGGVAGNCDGSGSPLGDSGGGDAHSRSDCFGGSCYLSKVKAVETQLEKATVNNNKMVKI